MRLANRVALVTGAAQGFGYAIAETFAREGARIVCVDLSGEGAEKAAAAIGKGAMALRADVSKLADVAAAAEAAITACGRIDILVNNAGTTHVNQPLLDTTEADFDRVYAVNVKSLFTTAKAVVPQMRRQGSGVIINIGSTAGIRPRPGLAWYNGSKGAVHIISKTMAAELASDGIRVVALAPVAGETPLLASFMGGDTPKKRAAFKASVPLGRFSTPQDIANSALFLASDEASFLTGVVLEVDGGRCI